MKTHFYRSNDSNGSLPEAYFTDASYDRSLSIHTDDSLFEGQPEVTWASGGENVDEWLYFGAMEYSASNIAIAVWKNESSRKRNVIQTISNITEFEDQEVEFSGDMDTLKTGKGSFEIAPFRIKGPSFNKYCLAYSNKAAFGKTFIRGYYCGSKNKRPEAITLVCAIDALRSERFNLVSTGSGFGCKNAALRGSAA